jgi:hypothetical protein
MWDEDFRGEKHGVSRGIRSRAVPVTDQYRESEGIQSMIGPPRNRIPRQGVGHRTAAEAMAYPLPRNVDTISIDYR